MPLLTDKLQIVPALPARPESGPMQFGNDWPGIFIRGDNALYYAHILSGVAESMATNGGLWLETVEDLAKLLASCDTRILDQQGPTP